MFWNCLPELDLLVGLLMIIVYGLISLRHKLVCLKDLQSFSACWPLLSVYGYTALVDSYSSFSLFDPYVLDISLAVLTSIILLSFKSLESLLLIMMGFIGQLLMLHSCDLVSFYVCLEMQNFSFLVLAGLVADPTRWGVSTSSKSGFAVMAALKYMLLSAFSSGVILFWFSQAYLASGSSSLTPSLFYNSFSLEGFMIMIGLLFKLGAAPIHLWVVHVYQSISKPLLMYISTAPKLSLFGFWVSSWHMNYTGFTSGVAVFAAFSLVLGSFGAYGQPALRQLFAYSTVNEIGLLLLAVETAGFHSLFQHLAIYIASQLLLWNLSDKRVFSLVAVSLAGLPPLAGFFGKAWIFWHAASVHAVSLLVVALFCTGVSLVYYLRVLRLFWYRPTGQTTNQLISYNYTSYNSSTVSANRVYLTSALAVFLLFAPVFLIKPFVL